MGSDSSSKGINKQGLRQGLYDAISAPNRNLRSNLEKISENKPALFATTTTLAVNTVKISSLGSQVEGRLGSNLSRVATDLNRRDAQIKQFDKDLKTEKNILIKLNDAIDSENKENIEAAKAELQQLRQLRSERQTQIESEQRVGGKSRKIVFNNQEKAKLDLPEINLNKISAKTPEDLPEIERQIGLLNKDLEQVGRLDPLLTEARGQLELLFKSKQSELSAFRNNAIKSVQGAELLADSISFQASNLTSGDLVRSIFSMPNANAIKRVLE